MAEKKGLKSRLFHKSDNKQKKEEEDKYKYEKRLLKMAVSNGEGSSGKQKGDQNKNQPPQNMAEAAFTFMEQANNPPTSSRRNPQGQQATGKGASGKGAKGKGGKKGGKVSTAMKVASFVAKHK